MGTDTGHFTQTTYKNTLIFQVITVINLYRFTKFMFGDRVFQRKSY